MDFNQCVSKALDDVVQNFIKEVSLKYDIAHQDLQNIWTGKTNVSSSNKRSKVVTKKEVITQLSDNEDPTEEASDNDNEFDVNSLQKCTVPELKAYCKDRGLKVGGNKSELLSRLLNGKNEDLAKPVASKTKKTAKSVKQKVDTKDVIKQLKANSTGTLQIRRNAHGNYQHPHTDLIFNDQGKVYGVQNDDGSIEHLTEHSIDLCNKYNLEYVIPENLDLGAENEDVDIEEIEEEEDDDDVVEGENLSVESEDDITEDELVGDDDDVDEIPMDDEDDDDGFY
jgi:hypothetical protein